MRRRQFFRLFWNIYDTTVVTSAIVATTVQIILTIKGNQNYGLLQIEKVWAALARFSLGGA